LRKATADVNAQNTVVLSGLKLKDLDSKTTGEIDFLIISLPLQSIIHIEVKRANTDATRSSASTQLKRGLAFFEKHFPFPSSENWNYTKMMCFGESVAKDICDDCKPFVLSANFIEMNMTQPVAKQIADQFISFWRSYEICQGKLTELIATYTISWLLNEFYSTIQSGK
jgi:hypothetical protein